MRPWWSRHLWGSPERKHRVNWGMAAERALWLAIGLLASAIVWIQVAR